MKIENERKTAQFNAIRECIHLKWTGNLILSDEDETSLKDDCMEWNLEQAQEEAYHSACFFVHVKQNID